MIEKKNKESEGKGKGKGKRNRSEGLKMGRRERKERKLGMKNYCSELAGIITPGIENEREKDSLEAIDFNFVDNQWDIFVPFPF